MFYPLVIIAVIIGSLSSKPTDRSSQNRNAAFEFREMITEVTGRSAWDYLGYGCYCGLGGRGQAIDALDTCCAIHDQCYTNVSTYLQFWKLCSPHLVDYSWNFDNNLITCTSKQTTCAYKTCMCDKIAAECFAQNIYNERYRGYSQNLCVL